VTGDAFMPVSRQNGASAKPLLPPGGKWIVGRNVPWSVSWTGEEKFSLRESQDFPGSFDLNQTQAPGVGVPKFAALNTTRQRMGMAQHLCHVCGKRTLTRDRYIFPVESGGFVTIGDNSLRYAGTVPPLHLACAKRASQLCPHLSQAFAQPVPFPSEETRLLPRPDVPEGMQEMAKILPKGVNIVYSCLRLYGPRFTAQVQKLRAAKA
jgi:hypothetical protein